MTDSIKDTSLGSSADEMTSIESPNDQQWEPGPDLEPPRLKERWVSISKYAWQHHRIQIIIVIAAMLSLAIGVFVWTELRLPTFSQNAIATASMSPSNWTDWWMRVQAIFGFPTLLVALFVWIGEIRKDWENDLSKRISVFFFHGDNPMIVCRYVWLAGADELRTWGQQIAKQAAGNKILDFRPDVDSKKPSLIVLPDGTICMHYAVCFKLTKLNDFLKEHSGECQYQNLAGKFEDVRPIPLSQAEAIRKIVDWRSCPYCGHSPNMR